MTPVQHFLNLTDDLICILNEVGNLIEVNANWKQYFQVRPAPHQTHSLLDLVHEDYRQEIMDFFGGAQRQVLRLPECRLVDRDGKSYWLDLKIRWIPTQNRYWCLLKDITLRKNIFSTLDQISETCNLGHWEYCSIYKKVQWGFKLYEIFNQDPVSFHPTLDNMDHFFKKEDVQALHKAIEEENNFYFDFKIINHFSVVEWVRLTGVKEYLQDGHYIVRGIIQNITKQKLKDDAQIACNIELSSFERALEQFSIVARTDANGRITHANEAFCRISKYTSEELMGKDHRIVNSGYHPKFFFKEMWASIKQGKTWRGEIKNKAKDGSYYWVDTIIIPICDVNGVLQETLSFRFEITALKQEQERNKILQNKINLLMAAIDSQLWSYDFSTHKMEWNDKMKAFFPQFEETPSLDTFVRLFDNFDLREYETFLKDPAGRELQLELSRNSHRISLQMKIMRNYLGDPVRMDGVCSIKRIEGPEESGSTFELAS